MGDYMIFNYQEAIERLESLEPAASEFLTRQNSKEIISDVRDYYFYLGVSHLALGRSKKLGKEEKAEHIDKAIPYLESAERITLENNFEQSDREIYFLGLAYVFEGRTKVGLEKLDIIEEKSNYYIKSSKLTEYLSSKY